MKKFIIEKNTENSTMKMDEGTTRTGKDEMNLVELPFTLLSKKNPNQLKTIKRNWIGEDHNRKQKQFYKIITSSDEWGLPTFTAEEVFLACMELSSRKGFASRKIYTSKYEIIKLMGWDYSGKSYKRLTRAFDQLGGIWIKTNAFWDNEAKKYREIGFGIIDDYMFFEEETKSKKSNCQQNISPQGNFNWNEKFFEHSLQKGNIKNLDIKIYFSLKTYVAKRLYRYADKKLYQQEFFEIDLFRLAFEKLEMVGDSYKYPSKIIQNLKPAIKELKARNLADITIEKSKTESGYKVCFNPSASVRTAVPDIAALPSGGTALELVEYFHQQITPGTKHSAGNNKELQQAEQLLLKYSVKEIKYIIKHAISRARSTKFDIQYFGAVLNYSDKAMLQLQQEIRRKEKKRIKQKKKGEQERLQQKYEDYRQQQIDDYIKTIPPVEYEKFMDALSKKIFKENEFITNKKSAVLKHLVDSHFNNHLIAQGRVDVLPIKEWLASGRNPSS